MRTIPYVPPPIIEISTTAARAHLAELLALTARFPCRVILIHHGKPAFEIAHLGATNEHYISPELRRILSKPPQGRRPQLERTKVKRKSRRKEVS